MMKNHVLFSVFLCLILMGSVSTFVPPDDDMPQYVEHIEDDKEDYYRPIEVVVGTNCQNYKTFKRKYSRARSKSKPLQDDDFDETFLTEDEIELEDVEYRETLALKHGQDPDKIWKSERLKKFMNNNPGIYMKRKHEAGSNKRRKRLAISNVDRYWTKTIVPYTWSSDFNGENERFKNGVKRAFNHIEYWTCIRFVEWSNTTNLIYGLGHESRLKLVRSSGCSSFIGRTNAAKGQKINCCKDRSCIHELSHAMGLFHEQRSPLHQDFVRITHSHIDLNETSYQNFREISPQLVRLYGRYDVSSVMHYGSFFGHNDYKDPMTVLDSDDELVLLNGDPTDFYLFEVLCDIMDCTALKCPDDPISCQNWGYKSMIKDRCQCRCIDGLDPLSGCISLYRTDLTTVEDWPAGGFTLLKPKTGCPSGFLEGQIQFTTKYTSESSVNSAFMTHDGITWTQSFCTKQSVSGLKNTNTWGPGKYCIYQYGEKCPDGFRRGTVKIDTITSPFTEGFQPEGDFTVDVKWRFCCRTDGKPNNPLHLPNREPIILFQKALSMCQKVYGMTSEIQYFRVKNVKSTVGFRGGSYPRVRKSFRNFYFYFCYYKPIDYAPELCYSRWPQEPFSMISSQDGCPPGFLQNEITQITQPVSKSEVLDSDISIGNNYITYKICSKEQSKSTGSPSQWQKGSYCILQFNGGCPGGFEEGVVRFDDNGPVISSLSDSSYQENLQLKFCCREDGMWSDPISLTTKNSFTLFRHNDFPCQKVVDMIDSEEFIQLRNAPSNKQSMYGFIPRVMVSGRSYQFHFCHYFRPDMDCGDIYELNDANPSVTITSPNHPLTYPPRKKCNYIFKGPEDSKLILNFNSFKVEATESGECVSAVEIRSRLPGQPEIKYCGDRFENTVFTYQNFLGISFMSSNNDYNLTGFSATITLIRDSDLCYTNNGTTYAGTVNVTKTFQKCLNWNQVTHCERSLYGRSDSASFLEKNYCRRAGDGVAPWCYTNAELCFRDYCDVCDLGNCYDIFFDCDEVIKENPNFCSEDEEAPRGCRKKCGLCNDVKPQPASNVKCKAPERLKESVATTFPKLRYSVGETVIFQCMTGQETETHTCLTDGSWSGGNYVCGRCPAGWIAFNGQCYKWFDVYMTVDEGKMLCYKHNATMTTARDPVEDKFLLTLRDNSRSFWLGMEQYNGQRVWMNDGSVVTWTNWEEDDPLDFKCANVKEDGKWHGWGCDWDYLSIICKFIPSERVYCMDYRSDCFDLIRDDPLLCVHFNDFAKNNCPRSCGLCGKVQTCETPTKPPNSIKVVGGTLTVGKYIGYICKDGFEKADGDANRACLRDGTLTGKPLVCLRCDLVPSRNNDVTLRSRKLLALERKMFIGNNEAMRIHKTGNVVGWMFYSMVNCEVTFSIWRYVSNKRYMLVGTNTITKSRHDRKRKVDIDPLEQISVQQNDIIGIYFAYDKGSCVPYDLCKLNKEKYGGQMESVSRKGQASKWIINTTYDFKTLEDKTQCKVWSFSAVVQ